MSFQPETCDYATLRQGDQGWKVQVVQIAFNGFRPSYALAEDGQFGPRTNAAAMGAQSVLHIPVDGIVGPQTQLALCEDACRRAQVGQTPKGLLRGIVIGESGGSIPCTSHPYKDGTRDYGPTQINDTVKATYPMPLRTYYSPSQSIQRLASELVAAHDHFVGKPGCMGREPAEAWRLAVLNYNWPEAAEGIANEKSAFLAKTFSWIEEASGGKLHTGWEWVTHYINSKVIGPDAAHPYVTNWFV